MRKALAPATLVSWRSTKLTNQINRNALRRRGFELHIAKLLELRRSHGHSSFYDADGYIRDYAHRYLRAWLSPDGDSAAEEGVPRIHRDETDECTLEELAERRQAASDDVPLFLEVLEILEREELTLFASGEADDPREAQMQELAKAYTVIDSLRWDRSEEDENVVRPKIWE
jgi:hypothetical protein